MNNRYGKLPYKYTPYGIAERRARAMRMVRGAQVLAMGLNHLRAVRTSDFAGAINAIVIAAETMQTFSKAMESARVSNRKVVTL